MTDAEKPDLFTVAAIGVVAFLGANVVHEGLGHGGACLLVGGRPEAISSAWFDGDLGGVGPWGVRAVKAGGTVANLVVGGLAALLLARLRPRDPHAYYALWLMAMANLFPGSGYLMVSPFGNFGDWKEFVIGLPHPLAWRIGLTVLGAACGLLVLHVGSRLLGPLTGSGEASQTRRRARPLAWIPYLVAGALVFPLAAFLNPYGPVFVLTTLLAHLGGSAWLVWLPEWVSAAPGDDAPPPIGRHRGWIAAGVAATAVVIGVLGPGVFFR
jgi:hypothetical protein